MFLDPTFSLECASFFSEKSFMTSVLELSQDNMF